MRRAGGDLANLSKAWWRTRGKRLVRAAWARAALVAMTAALVLLYGCARIAGAVVTLSARPSGRAALLVIGAAVVMVPVAAVVLDRLWQSPAAGGVAASAVAVAPAAGPLRPTPAPMVAPVPATPPPTISNATAIPMMSTQTAPPVPHREPATARAEVMPPHSDEKEDEGAIVVDQGFSVFATTAEAVVHQLGESLGFFEIGHKINEVFIPLKDGDTPAAVAKGAGAATEYGLAVYLVDAFEIMGLIASGGVVEAIAGIAGSMAIVRTSVIAGDQVEETTHRSLSPQP